MHIKSSMQSEERKIRSEIGHKDAIKVGHNKESVPSRRRQIVFILKSKVEFGQILIFTAHRKNTP